MKLLVSVSSAEEAKVAADGGADIIDAKDPARGALGPVRPEVLSEIRQAVGPARLVTAALGDADERGLTADLAPDFVARGARFVKVAFPHICDAGRVEDLVARAAHACAEVDSAAGVVVVAYADSIANASIDGTELVTIAARAGARGMLVDTTDKSGPGLMARWGWIELTSWISGVHDHGLFAAVAGKLGATDLAGVRDAGADVAGVRGAACVGGRNGRVSGDLVRALRRAISTLDDGRVRHDASGSPAPVP